MGLKKGEISCIIGIDRDKVPRVSHGGARMEIYGSSSYGFPDKVRSHPPNESTAPPEPNSNQDFAKLLGSNMADMPGRETGNTSLQKPPSLYLQNYGIPSAAVTAGKEQSAGGEEWMGVSRDLNNPFNHVRGAERFDAMDRFDGIVDKLTFGARGSIDPALCHKLNRLSDYLVENTDIRRLESQDIANILRMNGFPVS